MTEINEKSQEKKKFRFEISSNMNEARKVAIALSNGDIDNEEYVKRIKVYCEKHPATSPMPR